MSLSSLHIVAKSLAALALLAGIAGAAPVAQQEPKPKQSDSAKPVAELIQQLGNKDFYVRQRAQDELSRRGFEAIDALIAATNDPDLEIASRAKYLLRLMRVEWTLPGDPPEVKRCLRDYEYENAPLRESRMQELARLPNGQGIPALCRLVRYEKSLLLSKSAAVALLERRSSADPPDAATIEAVRKGLDGCTRPGAVWLLAWTRLGAEPEAVMAQWAKLTDDELNLLRRAPTETKQEIVAGLLRFQIIRLKKSGKNDAAIPAVRQLIELDHGSSESLAELLEWLVEQNAYSAIDDLAKRQASALNREPVLLYMLAQAYSAQGRKELAEETARRALALNPGRQDNPLEMHLAVAVYLWQHGQCAWARREFEHVIDHTKGGNEEIGARARKKASDMLHDQCQDLDAARTLEKLVEAIDAGRVVEAHLEGRKPDEIRAQMHYYFARHWAEKGDAAKQRDALDKAIEANPSDVDVLIACYRLTGQKPEYHAKIVEQIKKAAAAIREKIAEDPEDFISYNEFAWLIGNTEGDFDEALKYSQKSLELSPNLPGLYDTLARVYFAKGDLDSAVKQQTKAAEMDPHSALIRRQLEFFQKQRKEKKP
jgi:tetratricopeptide (TPR) repeat protein